MALLDLILGYDCNLACDYCTITPAMRARALSSQAVVSALRNGRGDGFDACSFTGGEPTIRADLLGLVRAAKKLGYVRVKVQSNGLLYAQRPNLERLVAVGADDFHLSIHTHDAAAYDALVRREGAFASMCAGLQNLIALGLDPTVALIVKSDTYARLPAAIDWLADEGVTRADLWYVSLTDQNRDAIESLPAFRDAVPSMRAAFARARERGMDLRSLHVPHCLLGDDADRAFEPARERVRVVTPDSTFDLSESRLTPNTHVPACEGCPRRADCSGVRPDYLEVYGDSEIAEVRGAASSVAPTRLRVVE